MNNAHSLAIFHSAKPKLPTSKVSEEYYDCVPAVGPATQTAAVSAVQRRVAQGSLCLVYLSVSELKMEGRIQDQFTDMLSNNEESIWNVIRRLRLRTSQHSFSLL